MLVTGDVVFWSISFSFHLKKKAHHRERQNRDNKQCGHFPLPYLWTQINQLHKSAPKSHSKTLQKHRLQKQVFLVALCPHTFDTRDQPLHHRKIGAISCDFLLGKKWRVTDEEEQWKREVQERKVGGAFLS